ncbi:protein SON isoform X1 [Harpegnathos saltator]|uniref:protein SON isoform X1 n=1 Tax=Harpegnathos saltator TaxID=610380 RepID=UPI00058F8333|nr:protein SON isoform X1 [Harpegnathos saltator]
MSVMTNLFDLAHLITTVGVDGVKIKPEPGLPEKSSNEILTELFSTFDADADADADDCVISLGNTDQQISNDNAAKTTKLQTKKKKSKKKHKHKEKKYKKKSRHNSSDSNSDAEGNKKKKKHKKKSKRRHESVSSKSSDSDHSRAKIMKLDSNDLKTDYPNISDMSEKNNMKDTTKLDDPNKKETVETDINDFGSPPLPPISKKKDESDEPIIPKLTEKIKQSVQGKILIKDLKNSTIYNETVKAIENKKKAKEAKMEDGELSDSSNDNRTPTLSPTPSRDNLFRSPSFSPNRDKKKSRMHSPTKSSMKPDLRLVLREKEKKKLGVNDQKDDSNHKDTKDKDKRSRSCHSQDRKRSRSRTRYSSHRSRSRGREKWRDKSREKRDRDKSNEKRDLGKSRERRRYRSRSEDRNKDKYTRGRSRSKERKERIEIDKKKLLEIARRNAINMIKQGTLPLAQQDKAIAAIQSGGKTVDELTDFCKTLSKSEALGELSNISSEEESEFEKGFHHPFLLKERPSSIIMNIKDAKQLPTKTFQEKAAETSNQLRLQFPVSSGQHHRKTESEWMPVIPKKPEPKKLFVPASTTNSSSTIMQSSPVQPPVQPIQTTIFPTTTEIVDIGSIVSQRLAAMRKLRENPNDVNALNAMHQAQSEMKTWAESKQMPGQFTGSTGAKVLTPAELSSGYQAWARKDQLLSAQPVSGGMGMALLQKMGWRPGEGLGKNKEGALEPLQLEVKLDKKGLVSEQDIGQKGNKAVKPVVSTVKTLEGKHPVSLLGEYCSKKKLGAPVYDLCFECGPDHRKNFLFKVKVNGIEYKPSVASPNKKQAKAEAAQICLQTLGLLPC